jgi:hypothetical protein
VDFCKSAYSCVRTCTKHPRGGLATWYVGYFPEAGFVGKDSFSYKLRSQYGTVAGPFTVEIDVLPEQ